MLVKPALRLLHPGFCTLRTPLHTCASPPGPCLWGGDPLFPDFFSPPNPPSLSSVLCDIARRLRIRPPPPKGLCRVSSISFPAFPPVVAETPLTAPDLQAVPGSSFSSPICSPHLQPQSSLLAARLEGLLSLQPRGGIRCGAARAQLLPGARE